MSKYNHFYGLNSGDVGTMNINVQRSDVMSFSPELAVEAQFKAYNEHDLDAFVACFSPDFKAYRMPSETPSMVGTEALREFYANNRFNNPNLRAELVSRTVLGNKAFDHELIHGLSAEPIESIAIFEVEQNLIKTAWFFFP